MGAAERQSEASDPPVRRPDPLRWVWYAFGGRLPAEFRGWILYDATSRWWLVRHAFRALTQLAVPIGLLVLFLPGPVSLRMFTVACGLLIGLFFALAYSTETIEHRVRRAGFPPGLAEGRRARAAQAREAAGSTRRHQANARRAARRG